MPEFFLEAPPSRPVFSGPLGGVSFCGATYCQCPTYTPSARTLSGAFPFAGRLTAWVGAQACDESRSRARGYAGPASNEIRDAGSSGRRPQRRRLQRDPFPAIPAASRDPLDDQQAGELRRDRDPPAPLETLRAGLAGRLARGSGCRSTPSASRSKCGILRGEDCPRTSRQPSGRARWRRVAWSSVRRYRCAGHASRGGRGRHRRWWCRRDRCPRRSSRRWS